MEEKQTDNEPTKGSNDDSNEAIGSSSPLSAHSSSSVSSDNSAPSDTKPKEKICAVCGDAATGTHFAAMTCEGCKGFFRRSMKKCSQFTCAFENECTINKSNRKHCQSCRLQRCLAVGMNSSLIMSDESVNRKRELIRVNREKRIQMRLKKEQEDMEQVEKKMDSPQNHSVQMMREDEALIKMLMDSHNASYDFSYEDYDSFRGRQHIASPDVEQIKTSHLTLAWLMAANSDDPKRKEESTAKDSSLDDNLNPVAPGKVKGSHSESDKRTRQELSIDSGDVSEMFSSLHGVAQPVHRNSDSDAAGSLSSTQHDSSLFSESACSISSSPYLSTEADLSSEPFPAGYETSEFIQQDMGINAMFGDSDIPGFDFDSMSYLQGLFQDNTDGKTHSLFQHFCDIMTWGIKKVIEFCKSITEFQELTTVDQINLLRGGCLEMLVLRSYFAFASDGNNYMSDKFQYAPSDFLQAGASAEFVEQYSKVHMRMRKMKLKVQEICLLIGLVLFSPDRPGLQDRSKVEAMQKRIAQALRAFEYTHKDPEKACVIYSELLLLLPVLRTINVLFSNTILTLKSSNEDDMNPLILEVNN